MDVATRTPLMELFRGDEVAREIRLLAAQGVISPRAVEQLGLLALLAKDEDPEVRQTADATLNQIPRDVISGLIARSDVGAEVREFFVARGVVVAPAAAQDVDQPLVDEDDTDYGPDELNEEARASAVQQIATMTVPQKMKAAMKGPREMRSILVRDPNKVVALSVLSSPKLTETEIEAIARMGNVSEDVLRTISRNRTWTKNYAVTLALVKNAKTPVAISLTLLARLNESDVRKLSTDRNVPDPLRIAARKKVVKV
jgi:hypothetical protein